MTLYKANLTDPENVEGNSGAVNVSSGYPVVKSLTSCR